MVLHLDQDTIKNLDMLREFFTVPENCTDSKSFLRKRRTLAYTLYTASQSQIKGYNN